MRAARLLASGLLVLALALASGAAQAAPRVVSLNPSLTAIVLALGAGDTLVGVDDWSARQQPGMHERPTVGGLFDPNLEAIVALAPDVVVLVPGAQQRSVADRLRGLGVEVLELPNISLEELLGSIEALGRVVERPEAAAARAGAIREAWARAERAAAGGPRPRTVLVLQRDPLYLVGRGSFLECLGLADLGDRLGDLDDRFGLRGRLHYLDFFHVDDRGRCGYRKRRNHGLLDRRWCNRFRRGLRDRFDGDRDGLGLRSRRLGRIQQQVSPRQHQVENDARRV